MAKGQQGISVTVDSLREKADEIAAIDAQLESANGGGSGGKRAIANRFARENAEQVEQIVAQIQNYLADANDEVRAGVFFGLEKRLNEVVGQQATKFVESLAEANKSDEPQEKLDPEVLANLRDQRKQKVQEFGALKGILEMFGQDISEIEEPKSGRGGPKGERGPRAINQMVWTVDGQEVPADKSTLSGVASVVSMSAKDFKAALTEAGVDTKNPGEGFTTTVNGREVVASKG